MMSKQYNTTVISAQAFENNTGLKTVKATSVLSVQNEAFEDCTALKKVELSVCNSIGARAFSGCTNLKTIDGVDQVSAIGDYAFFKNYNLSTCTFNNCLSIGNFAFALTEKDKHCSERSAKTDLEEISFPKCEYIGSYAFYINASDITSNNYVKVKSNSLHFPKCRIIKDHAFAVAARSSSSTSLIMYGISSLDFPECIEIGDYAFRTGKEDSVTPSNDSYSDFTYMRSVSSLNFPKCRSIGNGAFQHYTSTNNTNIKQISFPECSSVGSRAFSSNYTNNNTTMFNGISSVYLPKCQIVGNNAFDCLRSKNDYDVNLSSCLSIHDQAFYRSTNISSINLNSLKYMGSQVFSSSDMKISSLDLPNIESIGDSNMQNLSSTMLTSICFGPKLSSIGVRNFDDITSVIKLSIDTSNPYFVVDDGINVIYSKPGEDPKGKGLIEADLIDYSKNGDIDDNVEYVRKYASYNNSRITSFTCLSCREIESYAFYNCTSLSALQIDNVLSIGEYAFYGVNKVQSGTVLNLPNCEYVGDCAFSRSKTSNTKTEFIKINAPRAKYIGKYAFSRKNETTNSNLLNEIAAICIQSCLSVGKYAFVDNVNENCEITFGNDIPMLIDENGVVDKSSNIHSYFPSNAKFRVPENEFENYKQTWSAHNSSLFVSYNPNEERTSFGYYYYKGDEPKENEATIEELTYSGKMFVEDAVIPESITEQD